MSSNMESHVQNLAVAFRGMMEHIIKETARQTQNTAADTAEEREPQITRHACSSLSDLKKLIRDKIDGGTDKKALKAVLSEYGYSSVVNIEDKNLDEIYLKVEKL